MGDEAGSPKMRGRPITATLLVIGGVLVLVAVGRSGLGGSDLPGRSEAAGQGPPRAERRAVSLVDSTPWVVRRYQLAQANEPYVATVAGGVLWAAGTNGSRLTRLDRQGRRTDLGRYTDGGTVITAVAATTTAVWTGRSIFMASNDSGEEFLLRFERTGTASAEAGPTSAAELRTTAPFSGMAGGEGGLWVACCRHGHDPPRIIRFEPVTLRQAASIRLESYPCGVAVGDGAAWAVDDRGVVSRIDPATNRVTARIETPVGAAPESWLPSPCNQIAHAPGMVWVTGAGGTIASRGMIWVTGTGGTIVSIDPSTGAVTQVAELRVHGKRIGVMSLAAVGDTIWVVSERGELYRLNRRGEITGAARLATAVTVTADDEAVWVTDNYGGVRLIDPDRVPSLPPA
jgi:hypothetical protein